MALSGGLCCASSTARFSTGSSGECWPSEWGWPGQEAQARPWLLPWPVTQKYDLSKPPLVTSSPTPPQASVGDRVGGIITATCSLHLILNFTSSSFIMKCLRHFLLEILKKTINA